MPRLTISFLLGSLKATFISNNLSPKSFLLLHLVTVKGLTFRINYVTVARLLEMSGNKHLQETALFD